MARRNQFRYSPFFAVDFPFGARFHARALPQPSEQDFEPLAMPARTGNSILSIKREESISRMFKQPKQKCPKTESSQATRRLVHDLKRFGEIAQAKNVAQSIQRKTGLAIDPEEVNRLLRLLKNSA